jgi:hypothetical protein
MGFLALGPFTPRTPFNISRHVIDGTSKQQTRSRLREARLPPYSVVSSFEEHDPSLK